LTRVAVAQPGFGGGGAQGLVGAQGVWETEVPQRGPGAEPPMGGFGEGA